MARYIDADALGIGKADRNAFEIPEYAYGWNSAIEIIANAPTADVVPKSEVDKWKSASEQLYKKMSERMVEERKIERTLAVVQIIGEILSRHTSDVDGFFVMHTSELAELKKKYTEGGEDK